MSPSDPQPPAVSGLTRKPVIEVVQVRAMIESLLSQGAIDLLGRDDMDAFLKSRQVDGCVAAEVDDAVARLTARQTELNVIVASLEAEAVANQQRWDELLDEREQRLGEEVLATDKLWAEVYSLRATLAAKEAELLALTEQNGTLRAEVRLQLEGKFEVLNQLADVRATIAATEEQAIERWRELYRAVNWMVNDYIGVTHSLDYREVHKSLGYAHEGYHNARRVLNENMPPVPEGMRQGIPCKCWSKEKGTYAGTRHTHYNEPPYSCARCGCKAYEPMRA